MSDEIDVEQLRAEIAARRKARAAEAKRIRDRKRMSKQSDTTIEPKPGSPSKRWSTGKAT